MTVDQFIVNLQVRYELTYNRFVAGHIREAFKDCSPEFMKILFDEVAINFEAKYNKLPDLKAIQRYRENAQIKHAHKLKAERKAIEATPEAKAKAKEESIPHWEKLRADLTKKGIETYTTNQILDKIKKEDKERAKYRKRKGEKGKEDNPITDVENEGEIPIF